MNTENPVNGTTNALSVSLSDDMANNGCQPTDGIVSQLSNEIQRYHVHGDNPSKKNGWIVRLGECVVYGSWRADSKFLWWPDGGSRELSDAQRQELNRQIEVSRQRREEANAKATQDAKARLWGAKPADPDHPYLRAKNVPSEGILQDGDTLLVPMTSIDGFIIGLQEIKPNGFKKFPKGTIYLLVKVLRRWRL